MIGSPNKDRRVTAVFVSLAQSGQWQQVILHHTKTNQCSWQPSNANKCIMPSQHLNWIFFPPTSSAHHKTIQTVQYWVSLGCQITLCTNHMDRLGKSQSNQVLHVHKILSLQHSSFVWNLQQWVTINNGKKKGAVYCILVTEPPLKIQSQSTTQKWHTKTFEYWPPPGALCT